MAFVLDASVAGSWAFENERSSFAEGVLDRMESESAVVPALWWFEVRNLVIASERRGRITPTGSDTFLELLQRLSIEVDSAPDSGEILRLSRARGLTVYDAAYLELALRRGVPLATLDGSPG